MARKYFQNISDSLKAPTPDAFPFFLCLPFHGTLMGIEWVLLDCLFAYNNRPLFALVLILFIIHVVILVQKRIAFLKKNEQQIKIGKTIKNCFAIFFYIIVILALVEILIFS